MRPIRLAKDERARIVAFIRQHPFIGELAEVSRRKILSDLADAIERGEHWKPPPQELDSYGYPLDWPKCPGCGLPALDGHITCGQLQCDEAGRR